MGAFRVMDGVMLRFDDFRIDPAALHVFRGDLQLDAPPQVVEVLAHLIGNGDRTVSRQELLDRFWPRAGTGGDAALNTCIRRIRTVLGDDAEAPRYIQTRPRSGYRFIGALNPEAVMKPRRRFGRLAIVCGLLTPLAIGGAVWAHSAVFPLRHRIAVEPVQGLCEYVLFPKFNVGLRESFLAEVSHSLPEGYSVAETGKGADLHARVSVRQTPQRTVVVVTLIKDGDGHVVWSGEFAAPTDTNDYVPLQRSLAQRMAVRLRQALDERT